MVWRTKRGNTYPISTNLTDERGVVPLEGAAITFHMRQRAPGTKQVHGDARVVDLETGLVQYQWLPEDVDTAGIFDAEWRVVFAPGMAAERSETFPGGYPTRYDEVEILGSLDVTAASAPAGPTDASGSGITAYYDEHLEVIESGDTLGVLNDEAGFDVHAAANYPIRPVSLAFDVPLHGGVQFYFTVDAAWLDPPDDPGDGNGSFAKVLVALIAPSYDPAHGGLAPVRSIDLVPSSTALFAEGGDSAASWRRDDIPVGAPLLGWTSTSYGVMDFIDPGAHELVLGVAVQQWEMVNEVAQEGTHRVAISNAKLKALVNG